VLDATTLNVAAAVASDTASDAAAIAAAAAAAATAAASAAAAATEASAEQPPPPLPPSPFPPSWGPFFFSLLVGTILAYWLVPQLYAAFVLPVLEARRARLGPPALGEAELAARRAAALERQREEAAAQTLAVLERRARREAEERERLEALLTGGSSMGAGAGVGAGARPDGKLPPAPRAPKVETAAAALAAAKAARAAVAQADLPLPEAERADRRRALAARRLPPEPGAGEEALVLALRSSSWRGELRAERRFRPTDPVSALADFVESALVPEGLRGATLSTVFPRRVLVQWERYDLAALETAAHFDAFEARTADGAGHAAGEETIAAAGLTNREVLVITR